MFVSYPDERWTHHIKRVIRGIFVEIFQDKMDQLLQMIQSADPTDNQSDSVELLQLEGTLDLGNAREANMHISLQKLICYFM